jgi:hypothetical protein
VESGDAKSSGPVDDDDVPADGIVEAGCALITSFFQSRLFDVNVLYIIREYATYTYSTQADYGREFDTYSDCSSDSYSDCSSDYCY